jgi:hypothetical protein
LQLPWDIFLRSVEGYELVLCYDDLELQSGTYSGFVDMDSTLAKWLSSLAFHSGIERGVRQWKKGLDFHSLNDETRVYMTPKSNLWTPNCENNG